MNLHTKHLADFCKLTGYKNCFEMLPVRITGQETLSSKKRHKTL